MKKSEIAMIILIASISVIVSFFVAKSIFGDVYEGSAVVKTIKPISPELVEPDSRIFNSKSINPVVTIQIDGTE